MIEKPDQLYYEKDFLRKYFNYKDGFLYKKYENNKKVNFLVKNKVPFLYLLFNDRKYSARQIIWTWHYGSTDNRIGFLNDNRHDHRIENLYLIPKLPMDKTLNHDLVKEYFHYEDGNLFLKHDCANFLKNSIAGLKGNEYRKLISFNGKSYLLHRMIWFWHYGEMPNGEIDHVDRNFSNNRIENLRIATRAENMSNKRCEAYAHFDTGSKYIGVFKLSDINSYMTRIPIKSKNDKSMTIYEGVYSSEEDAARARDYYAIQEYGEFAGLNFPKIDSYENILNKKINEKNIFSSKYLGV